MALCIWRALLAGHLALALAAGPKPDGTCGYQCTSDAECVGCGTAGRCACPDAHFPEISCSCVSAPANPPAAPAADVKDSTWPTQWRGNVSAWEYPDFSNKSATADGVFYYDGVGGHSRADWRPFTNGKDATQVWIAAPNGSSKYYVKSGPVCIYFPITDPGLAKGSMVSVERPDWMANCAAAGMAKRVGREQVGGVWADHWSCRVEYAKVNQSITFQNWHSLGLDGLAKGLPLRVTGGNSAPNPTKGSPRLNSVWYSNLVSGPSAVSPSDFVKPSWLCIPVMLSDPKQFFGFTPSPQHVLSPSFHRRAHWAPHARPSPAELHRARSRPDSLRGRGFGAAMQLLNQRLSEQPGLHTAPCADFSIDQLHQAQRLLHEARSPAFEREYQQANDTRKLRVPADQLDAQFAAVGRLAAERPELAAKIRDGLCHETVMLYVHHLTAGAQQLVRHLVKLPLMPAALHPAGSRADLPAAAVHRSYTAQVSCAICHVV